ncbi:MAG: GIY-YIG nuclease family protein [bacterium]|nr:GIY-YIG nuclease family protein [bacterium]
MTKNNELPSIGANSGSDIRKVWHNEEWYFSIVDVISWATDRDYKTARRYWNNLKAELKYEGKLEGITINQFKERAPDRKKRVTDFCDTSNLVFVLSILPNKKNPKFIELLSKPAEFQKVLLSSKLSNDLVQQGLVYLIRSDNGLYKIGLTTTDVQRRLKGLQDCSPVSLSLEAVWEVYDFRKIELLLHEKFKDKRSHGEWFKLNQDDVRAIHAFMKQ